MHINKSHYLMEKTMNLNLMTFPQRSLATLRNDEGLTTVEYALGTLAAAALAIVLYTVVNNGAVGTAFEDIITDALTTQP